MKTILARTTIKARLRVAVGMLAAGFAICLAAPAHAITMGINLAFNPLNHTFASGYYNATTMGNYLTEIRNAHLRWVRVWACDGLDGLTFDGSGNCTGINGTLISNVQNFVWQANNKGITVEFVFLNSTDIKNHPNLVENTNNMNALINKGLVPLGKAIQGYTAQIDLVNEGDYTVGVVGWGYLRNFLGAAKKALVAGGVNRWVTMSIGYYTALTSANVGNLGFDFYEYHMYNDQGWCPIGGSFLGKPVELNEFGAATPSEGWNHNSYSFNQTLLNNYMNNAKNAGYAVVAPWCYINDGDYQLRGNALMSNISSWALSVNGS